MELIANYNRIRDIGNQVLAENEELVNALSDILKIIYEITNGWEGPDSENFQIVSMTYIKNLESITNRIQYVGEFLKKASSTYQRIDTDWNSTMKKIGDIKDENK